MKPRPAATSDGASKLALHRKDVEELSASDAMPEVVATTVLDGERDNRSTATPAWLWLKPDEQPTIRAAALIPVVQEEDEGIDAQTSENSPEAKGKEDVNQGEDERQGEEGAEWTHERVAAAFRRSPLFAHWPMAELEKLVASGERKMLRRYETVVREGAPSVAFFLVLEGTIHLSSRKRANFGEVPVGPSVQASTPNISRTHHPTR